jgi:hypothetical protein
MVATQGGVQGLWVLNSEKNVWTAIGSLDYYSRPREQVTLLMSVTLRSEKELLDVPTQTIGKQGSYLKSMVKVGLGTVSAVFRKCKSVRCRASLDSKEKMFRVSFLRPKSDEDLAQLLIKRTVDVLEVLRRPDFQCQQVVVNGHEMIWNRFRDIEYVGDAKALKPWVERREPFKTADLRLPTSAEEFFQAEKKTGLNLSILHDPGVCPLCAVSQDDLKERITKHGDNVAEYLQRIEGGRSQPDDVLSESVYHHGLCWRVELTAGDDLPEIVRDLGKIALSGPALATVLQTGALVYSEQGQWVVHEFEVPKVSSLPREFRESMVLVKAYRDLVPRALRDLKVPGSYLMKRKESWIVSPSFQDRGAVVWSARSDTTGVTYRGTSYTVPLYPDTSLEDATERFFQSVANTLPKDSIIRNLDSLREHVKNMLRLQDHKSQNLYTVELEGKGNLVRFHFERKDSDIPKKGSGSVRVKEEMTLEEAFESLLRAIDKRISEAEYELESLDELKESLSEVLEKIASDQGWTSPDKEPVEPPLNDLTIAIEQGRLDADVQELREKGESKQALEVIDRFLTRVRPAVQGNRKLIPTFTLVLLLKVELLVSGEIAGTVDSEMLQNVLDKIEEYSYHFEPRVLKSSTRFAKEMRWALALRESLRGGL